MFVLKQLIPNLKLKHLQSLTHNVFGNCFRIKDTVESPDFFDVEETVNIYITSHNKKIGFYLIKHDFSLVVDENVYPHIKLELQVNQSLCHCVVGIPLGLNFLLKGDKNFFIFTK